VSTVTQVCGRRRVRADAGYVDAAPATAAVGLGCDVAIAAKRNPAAWRALPRPLRRLAGRPFHGKARRSRPSTTLRPAGRRVSTGTYTLIRRVQVPTERLSADPRSRRTRTVAPDQLALTLGGADDAEDVWAVSFILTNIPASHGDTVWM